MQGHITRYITTMDVDLEVLHKTPLALNLYYILPSSEGVSPLILIPEIRGRLIASTTVTTNKSSLLFY